MNIILILSDNAYTKHSRVTEVGVTLRALLQAYSDYEKEIDQIKDPERINYLRLEQQKTGEVYQKLMDTIDAAKEGRAA